MASDGNWNAGMPLIFQGNYNMPFSCVESRAFTCLTFSRLCVYMVVMTRCKQQGESVAVQWWWGFQKSAVCGLIRGQFSVIETARDNHIHPDERSKDGISYHSVAPMDHYMLH